MMPSWTRSPATLRVVSCLADASCFVMARPPTMRNRVLLLRYGHLGEPTGEFGDGRLEDVLDPTRQDAFHLPTHGIGQFPEVLLVGPGEDGAADARPSGRQHLLLDAPERQDQA